VVWRGGGGLGAYEFGVLKALYEQRPGFRPAVVSGTSIGAITAAVLGGARGHPIAALERLWREKLTVGPPLPGWWPASWERSLAVLGNPGMYRLRGQWLYAPWACNSVYDTAPLRDTLAELVDLDTLNEGGIRVIVGAIDVATGEAKFFDNRDRRLSFDDVVASGSLPPGFPMTEMDGDSYWDGGLFSNTPLSPAINFLEEQEADDPSVCRELIVVELFPMRAPVPQTMPEVLERMVQLQYTSRLNLDRAFFRKIDQLVDLLQAIDAELPPVSDIRQNPTYQDMRAHRKIDRFHVVTATFPSELADPSDFSPASIDARIQAGYDDALTQGLGPIPARDVDLTANPPPKRSTPRTAARSSEPSS
jgi:predicted acylesterase/phospholipase RssA